MKGRCCDYISMQEIQGSGEGAYIEMDEVDLFDEDLAAIPPRLGSALKRLTKNDPGTSFKIPVFLPNPSLFVLLSRLCWPSCSA